MEKPFKKSLDSYFLIHYQHPPLSSTSASLCKSGPARVNTIIVLTHGPAKSAYQGFAVPSKKSATSWSMYGLSTLGGETATIPT